MWCLAREICILNCFIYHFYLLKLGPAFICTRKNSFILPQPLSERRVFSGGFMALNNQTIETCGGEGVKVFPCAPCIYNPVTISGEWLASRPDHFTPWEITSGSYWMGGWVDHSECRREKYLCQTRSRQNLDTSCRGPHRSPNQTFTSKFIIKVIMQELVGNLSRVLSERALETFSLWSLKQTELISNCCFFWVYFL